MSRDSNNKIELTTPSIACSCGGCLVAFAPCCHLSHKRVERDRKKNREERRGRRRPPFSPHCPGKGMPIATASTEREEPSGDRLRSGERLP